MPQRATLVQLALGEATLALVLERLEANPRLRPSTRARRAAALRYLQAQGGLAWAEWLFAETGLTRADLRWLVAQNYVVVGDAERWRDPLADVDYVPRAAPALTPDQQRAWLTIAAALDAETPARFLLRGVTGSGKTERTCARSRRWCNAARAPSCLCPRSASRRKPRAASSSASLGVWR